MTPSGELTTLYSFNGADESGSGAELLQTNDGVLYGTANGGGRGGGGVIFFLVGALPTPTPTPLTLPGGDSKSAQLTVTGQDRALELSFQVVSPPVPGGCKVSVEVQPPSGAAASFPMTTELQLHTIEQPQIGGWTITAQSASGCPPFRYYLFAKAIPKVGAGRFTLLVLSLMAVALMIRRKPNRSTSTIHMFLLILVMESPFPMAFSQSVPRRLGLTDATHCSVAELRSLHDLLFPVAPQNTLRRTLDTRISSGRRSNGVKKGALIGGGVGLAVGVGGGLWIHNECGSVDDDSQAGICDLLRDSSGIIVTGAVGMVAGALIGAAIGAGS